MKLFRILTTPSCWIRNHPTNKALDLWMIEALKNPEFSEVNFYTIVLNNKQLWIENYPYCYGYLHGYESYGLPSRSTVFALFDVASTYLVAKK
jgi:hypothetical protein